MSKTQKSSPAKRGRPRLPPGAGKRYPLNMRTTKELRDRLEEASRQSGRSLVQEVEFRVEQSFQRTDFGLEGMGFEHRDERSLVHHLGILFKHIRGMTNHDSLIAGAESFVEVEAGICEFFKAVRGAENRDFAEDAVAYDIETSFGRHSGKGLGELYAEHWRSEERLTALMAGEKYEEERPEPKRWRRTKKKGRG